MVKTRQPPPRKPLKVKGALPAPKVAPRREAVAWYKQRRFQVAGAVLVLAAGLLAVRVGKDLIAQRKAREQDRRTVQQFERTLQKLNAPLQDVFQSLSQVPGQFLSGKLSAADYRARTEQWLMAFRKLNDGIRRAGAPKRLTGLYEARALFVQGTVIYVDAAKSFAAAAAVPDAAEREKLVTLGNNMLIHGAAVTGMGERRVVQVKNDFQLNDPPARPPAVVLPQEQAPPVPALPSSVAPPAPASPASPAAP